MEKYKVYRQHTDTDTTEIIEVFLKDIEVGDIVLLFTNGQTRLVEATTDGYDVNMREIHGEEDWTFDWDGKFESDNIGWSEGEEQDSAKPEKSEGFINESGLKFDDISSEKNRYYLFPNGNELYVGEPQYLNVSNSGGHRLYTYIDNGYWCYYIKPSEGWVIRWQTKEGQPSFVK